MSLNPHATAFDPRAPVFRPSWESTPGLSEPVSECDPPPVCLDEFFPDYDPAWVAELARENDETHMIALGLAAADYRAAQTAARVPVQPVVRTCRDFETAGECRTWQCRFRHSLERQTCGFWLVGQCAHGARCRHLHGLDGETRARITAWHVALTASHAARALEPAAATIAEPPTGDATPDNAPADPRSLAVRLRRERLASEFPSLGAYAIEQVFEARGYLYEPTCVALEAAFPGARVAAPVCSATAATTALPRRGARSSGKSSRRAPGPARWVETGDALAALYDEARAEAAAAARERNTLFVKATQAFIQGDKAAATAFARLGRAADARMRGLHAEAAENIFDARNTLEPGATAASARAGDEDDDDSGCLVDLHGLHPAEAVTRMQDVLVRLARGGASVAYVVTGTGHHAASGSGKVLAAVRAALDGAGLYFDDASADRKGGMLAVTVPRRLAGGWV